MAEEGQATRSSTTEPSDATTRVADPPPRTDGDGAGGVVTEAPEAPKDEAPDVEVTERDSSPRAVLAEIIPELAVLAVAVYFFFLAGTFEGQVEPGQLGPAFWPRMAAAGLAIALVVRIVQTIRARNRPVVKMRSAFAEEEEVDVDWTRLVIAVGLVVGYVFGTMFLGYPIATAAFLTAFIWIGGQRRWYVPLIAIAGALISAYVFIGVVYVALPTGVGVFDTVTVELYRLLGIQ